MLVLNDISKSFGDVQVLNGVNLRLEAGLIYTLMGGNGSGKTTLINIISGFLRPTDGCITFKNSPIRNFSPYSINRLGIGHTFQNLRLVMQLTVSENVLLAMEKNVCPSTTDQQQHAYQFKKSHNSDCVN
ncbi:MAG: ATP-binding cassette domain-containing protein [Prevotellaceae bacterium]|jgi:branched-chain amino acid transport system ATP-binding protein|nr:ATP-binding cassette domain-containing protein [Prevotellaceae bacterium]